jgi:PEP-CTERM motif
MRKLVLTTLLLVLVGAVAAAWLSSSTPSGSAIGDINLAGDRIPGTGTIGFGVPPRQNPTAPARSSFTAGGTARAASPESSLPVPEMTIASSGVQAAYGAPTAFRQSLARDGNNSSGTRARRNNRSAPRSSGFGSLGFGSGGVGGGGGGATVAPRDPAPARERNTVRAERAQAPAASRQPASRPSPPSSGGGNGSGSPSSGGGGSAAPPAVVAAAPPPLVAAAPPPIVAAPIPGPAPAGPPPAVGIVPPFSPGASPSASPTPEPTTMLLLGTGIAGLYRMRRYLE